jgi:hypothetical protein
MTTSASFDRQHFPVTRRQVVGPIVTTLPLRDRMRYAKAKHQARGRY